MFISLRVPRFGPSSKVNKMVFFFFRGLGFTLTITGLVNTGGVAGSENETKERLVLKKQTVLKVRVSMEVLTNTVPLK